MRPLSGLCLSAGLLSHIATAASPLRRPSEVQSAVNVDQASVLTNPTFHDDGASAGEVEDDASTVPDMPDSGETEEARDALAAGIADWLRGLIDPNGDGVIDWDKLAGEWMLIHCPGGCWLNPDMDELEGGDGFLQPNDDSDDEAGDDFLQPDDDLDDETVDDAIDNGEAPLAPEENEDGDVDVPESDDGADMASPEEDASAPSEETDDPTASIDGIEEEGQTPLLHTGSRRLDTRGSSAYRSGSSRSSISGSRSGSSSGFRGYGSGYGSSNYRSSGYGSGYRGYGRRYDGRQGYGSSNYRSSGYGAGYRGYGSGYDGRQGYGSSNYRSSGYGSGYHGSGY